MTQASTEPPVSTPGSRPRTERRTYLEELVETLWSRPDMAPTGTTAHLMLPSGRQPTLVVPVRPRRAAEAMVRSYKSSAGRRTRLGLSALALGVRLGLGSALPTIEVPSGWPDGAATVTPSDGAGGEPSRDRLDIADYLTAALEMPVALAIYTSKPRANRKPILHLVTPEGDSVGFAKLGTTPLTAELVEHEVSALLTVGAAGLTRVTVPEVLHHSTWRGNAVLVQRALDTRSGPGGQADLVAAMLEVSQVGGWVVEPVAVCAYLDQLRRRVSDLQPGSSASRLAVVVDRIRARARASGETVTVGAWHGDWTPWNMAAGARQRPIAVWDWERFETGVPLGFDALHHQMQHQLVTVRRPPLEVTSQLVAQPPESLGAMLAQGATDGQRGDTTALLYLAEIGTRYLADRQADAGARLGDVATWILPALEGSLDARV